MVDYTTKTIAFDSRFGMATDIKTIKKGDYSVQISKFDSGITLIQVFFNSWFGTREVLDFTITEE